MEQTDTIMSLHDFPHKQRCNTHLVDRISLLPDSILGVILSCLPTKQAVATGLLSKRWTFVWREVHDLGFWQTRCHKKMDIYFIEFVNRVLHLHDAGLLNEFRLRWSCDHVSSHVNSWVHTALTKNVHQLSLVGCDPYKFHLPLSVFRCDSLRSLRVINTVVCVSDTLLVCLPRLECLKLGQVRFKSDGACEKLINSCPILKNLSLEIDNDDLIDFKCRISSPSLTSLEIYFEQESSFELNAPSLENLNLGGGIREIIIQESLTSLVEAYLDFSDLDEEEEGIFSNSIIEAIRAFGSAKVLTLISETNKVLERATISKSFEFKRLVKLVSTPCASLQDFICCSPSLELLEIEAVFKLLERPSNWITFTEVPRCFSNSLKKIKLSFRTYSEDDLEIIRLILEHGSRLEVVEIRCYGKIKDDCTDVVLLRKRVELTKKILKFPRKSPACRVDITEL